MRDPVRLGLLVTALAAALGAAAVTAMPDELARPDPVRLNIYFYLLDRWEPVGLAILALAALAMAAFGGVRSRRSIDENADERPATPGSLSGRTSPDPLVPLVALAVLVVSLMAAFLAHRSYPLSMDEWAGELQAKIFATGRRTVEIPEDWAPYARAVTPVFVSLHHDPPRWTSTYLPVNALLKTPLVWIRATELFNPLLGALTVLAIAAVARRLWPGRTAAPLVAAVLLGTSSQFLITSASFYTMPAHLLASVVWLWLHLHPRRSIERLTPWLGVLALGLHNFVVHTLFVVPFLLRLVRRRELLRATYYGAIYCAAGLGWLAWLRWAVPNLEAATSSSFAIPASWSALWQQVWNVALLVGWQPVAFTCLLALALARLRHGGVVERDLAWSALLTFVFYFLYTKNQGHGWSYRYVYAVLGNLVLLGTGAWLELARRAGELRLKRLLVASSVFALVFQIPYRLFEVRTTVTPRANASRWLATAEADALVLHPALGWYAQDLVRNEPGLTNRPVLLFMNRMQSSEYLDLRQRMDIRVLGPDALREFGIPAAGTARASPP
jgi:hypothetical protein